MASAKATVDHNEIRRWVEGRGGYPAHVKRTGEDDDPGVLRIDYPGFSGQGTLERISWDEWFDWFDRDNLAFLYQDESDSRFSKLVDRKTVDLSSRGGAKARKSSSRSSRRSIVDRITTAVRDRVSGGGVGAKKAASRKSSRKRSAASKKSSKKRSTSSSKKRAASSKSSKKRASSSRKSSNSRFSKLARR
ncbi:MAG TPA: hypothetical protein VF980_07715 [Thermoanaerobaculia bacterium]